MSHQMLEFHVGRRLIKGYSSIPDGGDVPGVLVIHGWWGLTDFFRSVCDRLADEGFVALAPDIYHGKTASTIGQAKHLRSRLKRADVIKELNGAVDYLSSLFAVSGEKIGVVGFSLGAYWALWLSRQRPEKVAAVAAFYGTKTVDYRKTEAAFLGHFAENDQWTRLSSVRRLEGRISSAGRDVTFHIYPGTSHWFFEEDRPDAYDAAAAQLAWKRTIEFLHKGLG